MWFLLQACMLVGDLIGPFRGFMPVEMEEWSLLTSGPSAEPVVDADGRNLLRQDQDVCGLLCVNNRAGKSSYSSCLHNNDTNNLATHQRQRLDQGSRQDEYSLATSAMQGDCWSPRVELRQSIHSDEESARAPAIRDMHKQNPDHDLDRRYSGSLNKDPKAGIEWTEVLP